MEDRLRELIDVVIDSLDEPADGATLARRAHFSRDHLDRLLAAATGESPVALRRRLLLERAAWQLRTGALTPSEAAEGAGYGSLAAFSRAFARAYGTPPSAFDGEIAARGAQRHPLPPARGPADPGHARAGRAPGPDGPDGLAPSRPRARAAGRGGDARPGGFGAPAAARLRRRLVRGRGGERGRDGRAAGVHARGLGRGDRRRAGPAAGGGGPLSPRFERAALGFERLAKRIRDRGAFDDAFVDALCEPPQSFTYGGVLSTC